MYIHTYIYISIDMHIDVYLNANRNFHLYFSLSIYIHIRKHILVYLHIHIHDIHDVFWKFNHALRNSTQALRRRKAKGQHLIQMNNSRRPWQYNLQKTHSAEYWLHYFSYLSSNNSDLLGYSKFHRSCFLFRQTRHLQVFQLLRNLLYNRTYVVSGT